MGNWNIRKFKSFPAWTTATFFTPELEELGRAEAEAQFKAGKQVVVERRGEEPFSAVWSPRTGEDAAVEEVDDVLGEMLSIMDGVRAARGVNPDLKARQARMWGDWSQRIKADYEATKARHLARLAGTK